ncbi:MAG: asparagine synthase (glutamine-hydrolyzing) [Bacteroidota bacterium]
MCGLTGWLSKHSRTSGDARAWVEEACDALKHRGPDDGDVWTDEAGRIALGHRRLSILDLSPEGRQPMASRGGRYVIAFNGEIYNHGALRRELPDNDWRGYSDTETMLAAIERWGVEAAVRRFVGMFAFALWDRERGELSLVRDRLGIKPLAYGFTSEGMLFASELSAFRAHPAFRAEVDRDALHLLLRYNSIPAPHTIYRGVFKVRPGRILRVRAPHPEAVEERAYWSATEVAIEGQHRPFEGTPEEAVDTLEALLRDAVGMRMLSDVPLGAFLSGGVDSSTVVALMQAQSERPVRTFSIGSPDAGFDEAPQAAAVAAHLGTDHTELYVTPAEALDVVPRLAAMYDEPFADSSQIPTFLVSQLARQSVTVALSGDGGDELFAGYNRHMWAGRVWQAMRRVPRLVRLGLARSLTAVAPDTWDRAFTRLDPVLPAAMQQRMPGYKLHKLAAGMRAGSPLDLYRRLASQWVDPATLVISGREPASEADTAASLQDFPSQMMLLDMQRYLPDDILTKVDRASMAVSLEARVPILDHRVVEFAWRLPLSFKLRNGQSKWVLRQVLYRHVPSALIERPKTGFGIPLGTWLRGPLRDWAESLLNEKRLREAGYFRPDPIRTAWAQHLAGTHAWEHQLWTILLFQAWLERQQIETGPAS